MAQELHPTLAAAMDAIDRRPLVKIVTAPMVGDIPFAGIPQAPLPINEGEYVGYGFSGYEELNPVAISLSNGEAAYVSIYGYIYDLTVGNLHHEIQLVTTTGGRTSFNPPVVLELNQIYNPPEPWPDRFVLPDDTFDSRVSVVELPNGNLGLAWLDSYTLMLHKDVCFHAAEITTAGVQVYPTTSHLWNGSIKETYADTGIYYWSGPSTIRLANGTYLSVFVHRSGGTNYTVWKKTSSDFRTWAARSAVSLSGLDPTKQVSNVFIKQLSSGDVILLFDYTESVGAEGARLKNLYYSISSDNGATWAAPVKITDYDTYNVVGEHPVIVQKAPGELTLVFTELTSVLTMGEGTLNWPPAGMEGEALSWDPVNRKLYVVNQWQGTGPKYLESVIKIDVDTWTIDKAWTGESIPAFPTVLYTWWDNTRNDKHLVAIIRRNGISLLDGEADTIRNFEFTNDVELSLVKNVDGWPADVSSAPQKVQVDADASRLYLFGWSGYFANPSGAVGYIDLTDPGPTYSVHMVFDERNWGISDVASIGLPDGDFLVVPAIDMVFITWIGGATSGTGGGLRIYQLSTGARILSIDGGLGDNPGFPFYGLYDICYRDGKIYGNFPYTALYGQQDRRGIVSIDLTDYACVYFRPSYATKDNYRLFGPRVLASGEILFEGWNGEGVVLWDPDSSSWTQYLSTAIPGLPADSWTGNVMYDELTGTIFANCNGAGVSAFSRYGFLYKSKIVEANYTTEWEFGAAQALTQTWKSYGATIALGVDDTMLAFWSNETIPGSRTIVWARDSGSIDLSAYIARGHDITLSRSIDGKPSSLEFTVTHGHLFDPTNRGSLWQQYLKKMRKLTLQFGEKVSGVDYWHPQGIFLVRETEVNHKRGEYPTMRVKAEDIRSLWEDMNVTATPHYEGYPEDVIKTVLQNLAGVSLSDIVLPTFRWRYEVWIQWLDTSIKKMVDQIGNRFGYAITIGVDGKVRAIKIAGDNPVDHEYADASLVVDWTPDDSFSDFTNRVVVVGESRDFMEVMYEEELIKQLMG
ncbi:MAG TPA: sialidase family protein, partial [Candidatus Paceibacterota bacterium]|nr:sialidase family protein [Candidatus Paceibacterota bacterium]